MLRDRAVAAPVRNLPLQSNQRWMFNTGVKMRWLLHAMMAVVVAGCAPPARPAQSDSGVAVDSIVLGRTGCLGTCPAYRLSVRADGFVRFESHNRGEEGRTESAARGRDMVRRIERELERTQFSDLPAITMGRLPYCRIVATDAPSITLSVYGPREARSVSYYLGCIGESVQDTIPRSYLRRLRALADSVDSIAAGQGWIRPARRP